jgi:predicted Rossmann-fold nucleotide-binding protein
MRVIVCGGRNFRSPAHVFRALDDLHAKHGFTALMQGGATGADQFAREWAETKPEIKRYVCKAQWDTYGRAAGPMRNSRMLEWKPDLVVAFAGGAGTADMVEKAEAAGVPVQRYGQ